MYELIKAAENTYYIEAPAKMGLYRLKDNDVYLIDSGNDKEAGKKVLKILAEKGWKLKSIINTHSNADHIGGNHLLQERTGCTIYAKGAETALTIRPDLEAAMLYGGYPCRPLQNKFLKAAPSTAEEISGAVLPPGMEIFSLPGHYLDMIGVRTPDDVCFMADCVSSKEILNKYHVSFIYDVESYLHTLDFIETMKAKCFIPAHTLAVDDMKELAAVNRSKVFEIIELLLKLCKKPLSAESVIEQVFEHYGLNMDFSQYVLVGSTIRSYLSYLQLNGNVEFEFTGNRLTWKTAVVFSESPVYNKTEFKK